MTTELASIREWNELVSLTEKDLHDQPRRDRLYAAIVARATVGLVANVLDVIESGPEREQFMALGVLLDLLRSGHKALGPGALKECIRLARRLVRKSYPQGDAGVRAKALLYECDKKGLEALLLKKLGTTEREKLWIVVSDLAVLASPKAVAALRALRDLDVNAERSRRVFLEGYDRTRKGH